MNREQQNDIIFSLWKAEQFITWNMQDNGEKHDYYPEWAYMAIKSYIRTGRAYLEWEKALQKANPEKLIKHMVRHAIKHDGSDASLIKSCTAYLKRYCGLAA